MSEVKPQLSRLTLPSGLKVVVEEDHRAPVVGVVSVLRVGAAADPPGKEGLAHLVEHLTFRSRPDGKSRLSKLLDYVGAADVNGWTERNETGFCAFGPKEALPALLTLEGARLAEPLKGVDPVAFSVERRVVRDELRQYRDEGIPDQVATWLRAAVFPPGSPELRAVAGTEKSLSGLTLADAKRFAESQYRPDRMILFVTGDVTVKQVSALLNRVLPTALSRPGAAVAKWKLPPAKPPDPPAHEMYRHQAHVRTPAVFLVWSLPPPSGDLGPLELFLAHSAEPYLKDVRGADDDVIGIHAELVPGAKASMLIYAIALREGSHPATSAERVLSGLLSTWRSETSWIAPLIFPPVRWRAYFRDVSEAENLETRAVTRARVAARTGRVTQLLQDLTLFSDLSPKRFSQLVNRYVTRKLVRTVFVQPIRGKAPAPATTAAALVEAPADPVKVQYPLAAVRKILHPPGASALRTTTLPNGLQVVIGRRPGWPEVTLALALGGGSADEQPPGVSALAYLASPKKEKHGTPLLYGAITSERVLPDETLYIAKGGNGNVRNLLAILADRMDGMEFPERMLAPAKEHLVPLIERDAGKPLYRATTALWRTVYGDGDYGKLPTADQIRPITEAQVSKWLSRLYGPKNAVLVLIGDLNLDEAQQWVSDWLGSWKSTAAPPAAPEVTWPKKATRPLKIQVTPRPASTLERIELGCAAPVRSPREWVGYQLVAQHVVGRLNDVAREAMGGSYGFTGKVELRRGGVAQLQIVGRVDAAHYPTVMAFVRRYWGHLGDAPPTEEALGRARWALARKYDLAYLSGEDLALAVLDLRKMGWPVTALDQYPEWLTAITPDELNVEAKACRLTAAASVLGNEQVARTGLAPERTR